MPHTKYPSWIENLIPKATLTHSELMQLSIDIASASAQNNCGPFGAVCTDATGAFIAAGWNTVTQTNDSTAHAEVNCLRTTQKEYGTFELVRIPGLQLFSSAAPCIQCFGAIYWSGIKIIHAGASRKLAEALGFDEGPVSDELWQAANKRKSIIYVEDEIENLDYKRPFEIYQQRGGKIY